MLRQPLTLDAVRRRFAACFSTAGAEPVVAFAPGRVNLIGDHIDYCGGRVLPMPIQYGTWVAAAANGTGEIRARSDNAETTIHLTEDRQTPFPAGHWGRFVAGADAVLGNHGAPCRGMNLLIAGDIPASGLSSSASLSVALLLAMGALSGSRLQGLNLALAAQQIEHRHVGVACGLMDQAAVVLGQPDAALRFDCATQEGQAIALGHEQCAIIVADSGVARSLAASAYNTRLDELARIGSALDLAPATLARTLQTPPELDDPVLTRRARHIATEQSRVDAACAALQRGDWCDFGRMLHASHASLRDDYAVSCAEVDLLVEIFARQPGCYGARMTGAGFGGAVVAAVSSDQADTCARAAAEAYAGPGGRTLQTFVARSRGGARLHD
ncbi:MAG: galactokinase [Gammaproteobacteria bacterium]|nr:galactokinase [Gammaproteobacteria bacterium]